MSMVSVRFPQDMVTAVRHFARRDGVTVSRGLRTLIEREVKRNPLPRPVDSMAPLWAVASPAESLGAERMLAESIVGSPVTVRAGLRATQERTGADEFIVAAAVHDFQARLRSYELLAQLAELKS